MAKDSGYRPTGPVDPVAAQIGAFFDSDPTWQGMTSRPLAETRAIIRAGTPISGLPAMERVEDHRVPVEGGDILVRLYHPVAEPPAIIVWAHGGGYALGSVDESDNFARALAQETGCAIASVDYRLAPEHKFPTAVNDMLAATRWVADRRAELAGADVPLFVAGDSAGANLGTVATRKLHEAGSCSIAGNILVYPCTDSPDAVSLERFEPPFLGTREVRHFLGQYLPDAASAKHPDFAPLHADNLGVLPPTFMITAEHDILTEQAEEYGRRLADAGVDLRISRHPGMIHGFATLDVFFAGAAGTAMREISAFVRGLA